MTTLFLIDAWPTGNGDLARLLGSRTGVTVTELPAAECLAPRAAYAPDLLVVTPRGLAAAGLSLGPVCQEWKRSPSTARVPLVFLASTEEEILQGLVAGADHCLPQWLPEELLAACLLALVPPAPPRLPAECRTSEPGEADRGLATLLPLLDLVHDFLWILDGEGRIVRVNRTVTDRLGYTEAELVGASILMVHPEECRAEAQAIMARMLTGEVASCPLPLLTKIGVRIPVETRIVPGQWQGREALLAISYDRTEQVHAQREIQRSQQAIEAAHLSLEELYCKTELADRAKSDFLANISHEFRTPLHAVLSFATFGLKKLPGGSRDDLRDYFEKIQRNGQILLDLVDDLFDLAQLESGRMEYHFEATDLEELLAATVAHFREAASARGISLRFTRTGTPRRIVLDPVRIRQVLENLVSNALKFSPDGAAIDLEVQPQETTLQVSVLDRGVGIPEDELEAVFDKFSQSSKTHTGAGGTGLGLAICREIVCGHGGRIWAANRPGGGAVVTLELPGNFMLPPDSSSPVSPTLGAGTLDWATMVEGSL